MVQRVLVQLLQPKAMSELIKRRNDIKSAGLAPARQDRAVDTCARDDFEVLRDDRGECEAGRFGR